MPEPTAHDPKLDFSSKKAARHVERMLDDAVEDSFPASDPVSLAMPHNRVESKFAQLGEGGTPSLGTLLLLGGGILAIVALIALRK